MPPKKKRKGTQSQHVSRRPKHTLRRLLQQANVALRTGRPEAAIALLERPAGQHPEHWSLQQTLGEAYFKAGLLDAAVQSYERARSLQEDEAVLRALLNLYAALDKPAHYLRTAQGLLPGEPPGSRIRQTCTEIEAGMAQIAQAHGLDLQAAAEALWQDEMGRMAMNRDDYSAAITAFHRAIALLPRRTALRNNLAVLLSYTGQVEEAMDQVRAVLEIDPDNLHGLGKMINFLGMDGRVEEARPFWERLRRQSLAGADDAALTQVAEAAAWMEDDTVVERVIDSLIPKQVPVAEMTPQQVNALAFRAAAAANRRRWEAAARDWTLLLDDPAYGAWADRCLAAVQARRPGPGWAARYPYFPPAQLLPEAVIEEADSLARDRDSTPPGEFRARADDLARRYPQLHYLAELFLLAMESLPPAIPLLQMLATPRAVEILRRFALGQAGPDEARREALRALVRLGAIAQGERVRMWMDGKWREIEARLQRVSDEVEWPYAPELYDLYEQAFFLQQEDRDQEAEPLYQEILARDPLVKEAYNNLAAIYAHRGEEARAREMMDRALALDPLYVFPRCSLALASLEEKDVVGARAWIAPLAEREVFHSQEMAYYQYVQARILAAEGAYEKAEEILEDLLELSPDYKEAQEYLLALRSREALLEIPRLFQRLIDERRASDARHRRRIRDAVTTENPRLEEVLAAYTKDALAGMLNALFLDERLRYVRKVELVAALRQALLERESLGRVVATLDKEVREALGAVLDRGGVMPSRAFRRRYGDDREESLRWQYHAPESVAGQLRVRGLLTEGLVEGKERMLVPAELREVLRELLG